LCVSWAPFQSFSSCSSFPSWFILLAEYGDQYGATDEAKAAIRKANLVYHGTVKVARVAFRNDLNAQGTLRLFERRKRPISAWFSQAMVFYNNLLKDSNLLAEMERFAFNSERL
jgi:hypothetical protein